MNIKIKHIFYIFLILTLFLTLGMVSANEDNVNQKVSLKEAANVDTTHNSDNYAHATPCAVALYAVFRPSSFVINTTAKLQKKLDNSIVIPIKSLCMFV